jgi:hypothetical protein
MGTPTPFCPTKRQIAFHAYCSIKDWFTAYTWIPGVSRAYCIRFGFRVMFCMLPRLVSSGDGRSTINTYKIHDQHVQESTVNTFKINDQHFQNQNNNSNSSTYT